MLKLTDRAAVKAALTDPDIDPELRALLGLRVWQLDDARHQPLGETIQFVVVQPGDTPDVIHDAIGFPICWDQADQPGWEWISSHPGYWELGYVLTDDFGVLVFVTDHPDTNHTLLFNCLGVADRNDPT